MQEVLAMVVSAGGPATDFTAPPHDKQSVEGETSVWVAPDAFSIKQLSITPWTLQRGNDQDKDTSFQLLRAKQGEAQPFEVLATLTYDNGTLPSATKADPLISLGEVWDLGITVLQGERLKFTGHQNFGVNQLTNGFQFAIMGTWLRDGL